MKLLLLLVFSSVIFADVLVRKQVIMGTIVTIKIDSKHKKLIQNTFDIIKKVDKSISTFREDSIIYQLNEKKSVNLDALSFEALSLSKIYYQQSDGYFNIAIGSITKDLYRFGLDESVPSNVALMDSKVSFNSLTFDSKEARLKDGIKVDLGGMGKGFGVDKMSEYLLQQGVMDAVISASGDIRCLSKCLIDIQDPFADKKLLSFKTIQANLGITTSGNYNRFVKDKTHNHLINPKTKSSAQIFASITLVGDMKSSALDAYATAASVMPRQKAFAFLDSLGVAFVVVEVDGKTSVKSSDFFELK